VRIEEGTRLQPRSIDSAEAASGGTSDGDLMEAYGAGDQRAFDEIFRRYGARVLRRMRRSVGEAEALDLTQQTFLQMHRSRRDFRPGAALRPWLMTIAQNVLRDHLRRVGRRLDAAPLLEEPAVGRAIDDGEETREILEDSLQQLPVGQRLVVRRFWFDHRSHADIARELGISRGAVKLRAHRAYAALRRILEARGFGTR
jgi:RNA polymerase sigma-70 factor (ECF subfamily)